MGATGVPGCTMPPVETVAPMGATGVPGCTMPPVETVAPMGATRTPVGIEGVVTTAVGPGRSGITGVGSIPTETPPVRVGP
jgi:hypothetical protein